MYRATSPFVVITPEGKPRIWRTVELTKKHTLHHLHTVLQKSFELKGKHLYAFYMSGKEWDTETEYGGPSAGSSRKANKAELGKLPLERGRSFLCVCNFAREQRFSVEWKEEREGRLKEVEEKFSGDAARQEQQDQFAEIEQKLKKGGKEERKSPLDDLFSKHLKD